jgi:hypothetical protein
MSRRSTRKGRPYQPLPERQGSWVAKVLVLFVAFILVMGFAILTFAK